MPSAKENIIFLMPMTRMPSIRSGQRVRVARPRAHTGPPQPQPRANSRKRQIQINCASQVPFPSTKILISPILCAYINCQHSITPRFSYSLCVHALCFSPSISHFSLHHSQLWQINFALNAFFHKHTSDVGMCSVCATWARDQNS